MFSYNNGLQFDMDFSRPALVSEIANINNDHTKQWIKELLQKDKRFEKALREYNALLAKTRLTLASEGATAVDSFNAALQDITVDPSTQVIVKQLIIVSLGLAVRGFINGGAPRAAVAEKGIKTALALANHPIFREDTTIQAIIRGTAIFCDKEDIQKKVAGICRLNAVTIKDEKKEKGGSHMKSQSAVVIDYVPLDESEQHDEYLKSLKRQFTLYAEELRINHEITVKLDKQGLDLIFNKKRTNILSELSEEQQYLNDKLLELYQKIVKRRAELASLAAKAKRVVADAFSTVLTTADIKGPLAMLATTILTHITNGVEILSGFVGNWVMPFLVGAGAPLALAAIGARTLWGLLNLWRDDEAEHRKVKTASGLATLGLTAVAMLTVFSVIAAPEIALPLIFVGVVGVGIATEYYLYKKTDALIGAKDLELRNKKMELREVLQEEDGANNPKAKRLAHEIHVYQADIAELRLKQSFAEKRAYVSALTGIALVCFTAGVFFWPLLVTGLILFTTAGAVNVHLRRKEMKETQKLMQIKQAEPRYDEIYREVTGVQFGKQARVMSQVSLNSSTTSRRSSNTSSQHSPPSDELPSPISPLFESPRTSPQGSPSSRTSNPSSNSNKRPG